MRFLDLCAGIGGFSLGLEWAGMECAGQVEIDDYCNKVLQKHWPNVPRWGDIKTVNPADLPAVDLICGGYPCQPFSVAGKRRGAQDDRHLWPYVFEIVTARRPAWCLFENVAGHVSMGLDAVLSDLAGVGYACQALVIPACAVGAWHERNRVWVVAHAHGRGKLQQSGGISDKRRRIIHSAWCETNSKIFGDNDGISERVVGMLGNAVVPQVVAQIGRAVYAARYGLA